MKITFICGSLEPGRDGVGDYTANLALELNRNGYETSIIAINDIHLPALLIINEQVLKESVKVLRIPSSWSAKLRFSKAQEWINKIDPEWLSLQLVPFSFHTKGLPLSLGNKLFKLGKGRQWHIMFHELWVGMPTTASLKHQLWGWMQQYIIKSLVERLGPKVIHTHCGLYILQLRKIGINVFELPLFSNVSKNFLLSIKDKGDLLNYSTVKNSAEISIIMFGTIHPQAELDQFIHQLNLYRRKHGAKVYLTLVGNLGDYKKEWICKFQREGMSVKVHGEQQVEFISNLLTEATFGVSTSALATIEKSGTVAAMLEHALPVLCVGDSWKPRKIHGSVPPRGVYTLKDGCIEDVINAIFNPSFSFSVASVARNYCESLKKLESNGRI
jgi:hypothetical protein